MHISFINRRSTNIYLTIKAEQSEMLSFLSLNKLKVFACNITLETNNHIHFFLIKGIEPGLYVARYAL